MDELRVYAIGPFCASVCVPKDMTPEAVEQAMNEENPQLGELRWFISKDETFNAGGTNPCSCNTDPERLHYLMDI